MVKIIINKNGKFLLNTITHVNNININTNVKILGLNRTISLKPQQQQQQQSSSSNEDASKSLHHDGIRNDDIEIYTPKSILDNINNNDNFSIDEPQNDIPWWMLRYFPEFFKKSTHVGPEEHDHPMGVSGVYGYITALLITCGLSCAALYELLFTDSHDKTRAALRERRIREKMQELEDNSRLNIDSSSSSSSISISSSSDMLKQD